MACVQSIGYHGEITHEYPDAATIAASIPTRLAVIAENLRWKLVKPEPKTSLLLLPHNHLYWKFVKPEVTQDGTLRWKLV